MTPTQKLIEAAQQGNLEEVLRLIPLSDPKQDNSEALAQAARHGHLDCVEALLPVSEPCVDNSFALWISANQGHSDCVAALIPHSRVKDGNCRALRTAARFGHLDCVEILQTQHSERERIDAATEAVVENHLECFEALTRNVLAPRVLIGHFFHCLALEKYELADTVYDKINPHLSSDEQWTAHQRHPDYFLRWEAQKQHKVLTDELQTPRKDLSHRLRKM